MQIIIITNNEKVFCKYKDSYNVDFENISYKDILLKVRDKVHNGYEVLTHPLSSSIKPNETPYKSIVISKTKGKLNYNSLNIIENSIITYNKFEKLNYEWADEILKDFKVIDYTSIESALNQIGGR